MGKVPKPRIWASFCTSGIVTIIIAGYYCWLSHDVTKIQTTKLSTRQLKTNFHTNFRFKRVLGFVIEYA